MISLILWVLVGVLVGINIYYLLDIFVFSERRHKKSLELINQTNARHDEVMKLFNKLNQPKGENNGKSE